MVDCTKKDKERQIERQRQKGVEREARGGEKASGGGGGGERRGESEEGEDTKIKEGWGCVNLMIFIWEFLRFGLTQRKINSR